MLLPGLITFFTGISMEIGGGPALFEWSAPSVSPLELELCSCAIPMKYRCAAALPPLTHSFPLLPWGLY